MLLDSGADVTLVQRSSVDQLGAVIDTTTTYEVCGFDGTVMFAHVVELDLVFLGRSFRGSFLVTDEDVGILGRNVLNQISIVLDGPHLFWSEAISSRS